LDDDDDDDDDDDEESFDVCDVTWRGFNPKLARILFVSSMEHDISPPDSATFHEDICERC